MLNKCRRKYFIFFLIACICLSGATRSSVAEAVVEARLPDGVSAGMKHFLNLVDPARKAVFNPRMIDNLLDFVAGPKNDNTLYYANLELNSPSAYYAFDIKRSFAKVQKIISPGI